MLHKILVIVPVVALLIGGCSDDDDNPMAGNTDVLTLNFSGLEDLGPGYVFEGWLLVGGSPVSTGVFTIDSNGNQSQTNFNFNSADLMAATKFILTIEPSPDLDPLPSNTKYLAGDFVSGSASLAVADVAAFGNNFLSASGSYILETPSTSSIASDYAAGIWWLDPAGGPGPSLILPVLPSGWVYEGWVVGASGPVTTGTFSAVDKADADSGGPTAGTDATPPFPGQDYINPLMNLIGYAAVISVEPSPDNSPAPFTLKPLVDSDVIDVGAGVLQTMGNTAATFPTGTATR